MIVRSINGLLFASRGENVPNLFERKLFCLKLRVLVGTGKKFCSRVMRKKWYLGNIWCLNLYGEGNKGSSVFCHALAGAPPPPFSIYCKILNFNVLEGPDCGGMFVWVETPSRDAGNLVAMHHTILVNLASF